MSNETKSSGSRKKAASAATTQSKAARRTAASPSAGTSPPSSPAPGNGTAQATQGTTAPGIKHKFTQQLPPEESFADGAHSVTLTRNVLKLDLYRVLRYDQASEEELRKVSHRIVLPMSAVPEMINLLQGVVQAVKSAANQPPARSDAPRAKNAEAAVARKGEPLMGQQNPP